MTLTDAQIDRYSRQIIVPRIGGRGQERLLAARILLVGDARDMEAPLAYLVGGGVGTICLKVTSGETVTNANESQGRIDLALMIIGSEAARKAADEIANDRDIREAVIARLDAPGKITIIRDAHGQRTVDIEFGTRAEAADFIAMLATTEAFKLIAGYVENPSRTTIDFDGYETRVRVNL